MSCEKQRIHDTDTGNLISNLRGEVGEIITSWTIMRSFMDQAAKLKTKDLQVDFKNAKLITFYSMIDKLEDEIISRLSELAEHKTGQLTFYFAYRKLKLLENEVETFTRFIKKYRFNEKRNYDISHKQLPEQWTNHKIIIIPYPTLVKGIVLALRLMKSIDNFYLGPRAKYLWCEMRKERYKMIYPAKISYMLMQHMWLSHADRFKIIQEEIAMGRAVWKDMPVKINGKDQEIKTYGELGAIMLGPQLVLLDEAFIELTSIDLPTSVNQFTIGSEYPPQ
jgi:hypothetical protein